MGGAGHDERALKKMVVAGASTVLFEASVGHPIEFLKVKSRCARPLPLTKGSQICKQTAASSQGVSYAALVRSIAAQKGARGLWDGFFPWGLVQAATKGAVFGMAQVVARQQLERTSLSADTCLVLSGGIAGGAQGLALSPCLLLKTRVMTDASFRGKDAGAAQSLRVGLRVIRTEGPLALMKGSGVFALKRVADWTTRYWFADASGKALFGSSAQQSSTQQLVASLCGGALSTLATLPMDVLVAQIQQASRAGVHVSALGEFAAQLRAGGLVQLLRFSSRGLVARICHVALTTAMLRTVTDLLYNLVSGDRT